MTKKYINAQYRNKSLKKLNKIKLNKKLNTSIKMMPNDEQHCQ